MILGDVGMWNWANGSLNVGFQDPKPLLHYRATYVNERGELMGFAQHYRSEGEQLGLKKGILIGQEEGRQEEAARLLRRQLTRRFGPLPEWAEVQLSQATTDQLEHWADRILDAKSLDAVFSEG